MTHKVTLIPGDGMVRKSQRGSSHFGSHGVKFEWESYAAGADAFAKYHEYIPKELTESIERTALR